MNRSSIYNVLDQMNSLEKKADKYDDKASEKYDAGNEKSGKYFERTADDIRMQIEGYKECLKALGFGIWCECGYDTGYIRRWHIPLDDIERVC